MKINITVNSGAAYVISLLGCVGYALFIKAPYEAFWISVASLYGWHSGRRLWRELKLGTLEVKDVVNPGEDTPTK